MLIRIKAISKTETQTVYISGDSSTLESLRQLFLTSPVVDQNILKFNAKEVFSCKKCGKMHVEFDKKEGTVVCETCRLCAECRTSTCEDCLPF